MPSPHRMTTQQEDDTEEQLPETPTPPPTSASPPPERREASAAWAPSALSCLSVSARLPDARWESERSSEERRLYTWTLPGNACHANVMIGNSPFWSH